MTDKVLKIREEVERLAQLHLEMLEGYRADGNISAAAIENVLYGHDLSILSFIDSLQEEPVSGQKLSNVQRIGKNWKELEGEIKRYLHEIYDRDDTVGDIARHFVKWQKEQMMSKAFPVEIDSSRSDGRCILSGNFARFETGDKVKVIVIKED